MVNTNLRRSRTSSAPPTATQHHSHTDDRYNGQGTTQPSSEPLGLVAALKTHSLLLAGDVELNPGPLSEADWEKALKLLVEAVVNDSVYYEPVKQLMTVPVRQIMNQSVQPYLKLLVLVVYQIVEMMKRDTHKVTVDFIRSLLPTPNTLRAATSGGSALGASQNLLAKGTKETLEEVVESAAKSSTTQVVKITAKAAAKQAARSALIMGGAVDTCIFAVRTYNDLSQAEEGNISSREFKKRLACNAGSAVGSTTVGAAGAATGAAIGTVILPGIGTAIGAIVGNIIGGTAGSYTGRYIGDQLSQYSAD